jgi:TonB-dependent receptor
LDEDTYSAGVNYNFTFAVGTFAPSLKTGAYTEYRSRSYLTRDFLGDIYNVRYMDITEIMHRDFLATGSFSIFDNTDNTFDYSGKNLLASGYAGLNIPVGKFNVYAGVRYENNLMKLTNNTKINTDDTETYDYKSSDFFPSMNVTYNLNKTNLLRLAYGKSINRQEFREVSPSAYYDFDLFSYVRGNKKLQQAYIQNFDLRYEIYPSNGEMVSFALFYKRFTNPIEWTFIDGGGTYTYTFENAEQADNYGAELDMKKSLDFIGLPDLSLSFNGALIRSNVVFGKNSMEHDRPMQGQSPYLVNTGLFYRHDNLNMGLMYNIIGKRIVGIGRNDNSQGGSIDNDVPDMFEMPRHALDLSLSYKCSEHLELSFGVRDMLGSPYTFKQFPKFTNGDEKIYQREQTTKEYKTGQNFSLSLKINL